MAKKTLSAIRALIRQMLRDEFVSSDVELEWEEDELDLHIGECLAEISECSPYEKKETVKTTAGSVELDISSITDLLYIDEVEYRVGKTPKEMRDCSIFGDILTIETDLSPLADEDVYLYCHKLHQLTESTSTLKPQLERILILGVTAKAALSWSNEVRKQITVALSSITEANTTLDSMTARITQAINDLVTGRTKIGIKITEATTAITNMSARITQALADLTSGRALIGSKKTQAISALDAVSAQITQAISDLTSGRAQIGDTRTIADTAIDNMLARITQAQTDLTTGRTLINKINIGGRPEDDYVNYAGRELSIAVGYLNQARGYLGEITTADRYQGYAARDLQTANTYISQARGYLALDVVTSEYGNYAARELANASEYLAQARGFLALDAESAPYANYAMRELSNATAYLNQSGGYIRELSARFSAVRAMSVYQNWANNQFVLYQRALNELPKPRIWIDHPRQ